MQPIVDFFPLLTQPKKVVITTHQKPDGDAMGSSLGLYHFLTSLGHSVTVISTTNCADIVNLMLEVTTVLDFELYQHKANEIIAEVDGILCSDYTNLSRINHFQPSNTQA